MRSIIEIDGKLNSGLNGCMLKNCSISGGETAAGANYIQNFKRNRKKDYAELENYNLLAAFISREDGSLFILTEKKSYGDNKADAFQIWRKTQGSQRPYMLFGEEGFAKKGTRLNFSFDYAKINTFTGFDCILVCAFGVLVAFSEYNFEFKEIDTSEVADGKLINGICAFGNRMVATFENSDQYFWSGIARGDFELLSDGLSTGAGFAASEYANDKTRAVRRTGSRLAVFTTTSIEIKDLSQDQEMPFQGYLYQNNYDIGALTNTLRSIDGVLYFVGQEGNGNRFIYSLADGVPQKLTNDNQSKLLSGRFESSGTMHECGNTFYCVYGSRDLGIDIGNGSLFEIDRSIDGEDLEFIDYMRNSEPMLRVCRSGFYYTEPGSDDYVMGKVRLPKNDFGAAANISKISFIGEFLESKPAVASLTAERGFYQQAQAHRRGFDFFLLGLQKLNDIEFSVNTNFRLTKIEVDYQLLKNGSYYGAGG